MKKEIKQIPVSQIVDDPDNIRKEYEEIEELADSIENNGQEVPISAWEMSAQKYMIDNGHRRVNAIRLIKKRQKKEQMVDTILVDKMSKEDKLLKRCVIDAQQTNVTVKERDKAWKKLWEVYSKRDDFTKAKFCRMLGAASTTMTNFMDRMELGEKFMQELDEGGVGSDVLSETKGLEPEVRKKVLKMAKDIGIGCRPIREIKKVVKGASNTIIDAVTSQEVTIQQAQKLKILSEDKQKTAIKAMKATKGQLDQIPKLVSEGVIKKKVKTEEEEKQVNAQEFVDRLQDEIVNTSAQMSTIEGVLHQIEEEDLEQYFNPNMKEALKESLQELTDNISPALKRIEKTIKKWGGANGKK